MNTYMYAENAMTTYMKTQNGQKRKDTSFK